MDYPDIENPLVGLFNTGGGNNKYNCSNADADAAYAAAAAATSEDARIKAYQDVETAIVDNLCGIIPLYQDSKPFLVSSNLGGVVANGTIDAGGPGTVLRRVLVREEVASKIRSSENGAEAARCGLRPAYTNDHLRHPPRALGDPGPVGRGDAYVLHHARRSRRTVHAGQEPRRLR